MDLPAYLHPAPEGTGLDVYVQPGAAREGVAGIHGDALKLKVRAAAQDGKANRAVVGLLADILDVPKSRMQITSGQMSRNKKVVILGATPREIAARLNEALAG